MTVNDASLGESGSKLSKVAATSLLMGVTRASSEAYDSDDMVQKEYGFDSNTFSEANRTIGWVDIDKDKAYIL